MTYPETNIQRISILPKVNKLFEERIKRMPLESEERFVKLISVGFKEASLDSPTFRASVNFTNQQIQQVEAWLNGIYTALTLIQNGMGKVEQVANSIEMLIVPDVVSTSGVIDNDYTQTAMVSTGEGLKKIFLEYSRLLHFDTRILKLVENLVKNELNAYKIQRMQFETIQLRYDKVSSLLHKMEKTKPLEQIKEESYQLYEVRKQYLESSLELYYRMARLTNSINFTLIEIANSFWSGSLNPDMLQLLGIAKVQENVKRIYGWKTQVEQSSIDMMRNIQRTKTQTEIIMTASMKPPNRLSDYDCSLLSYTNVFLEGEPGIRSEKHGWLYMKTSFQNKVEWVKRWVFVKDGLFGIFSLSDDKLSVQETNKIGLGLINFKFAPGEERRFCFELKTLRVSIMLQAETLLELKTWMTVLKIQKEKILNKELNHCFVKCELFPPMADFASNMSTYIDTELTTIKGLEHIKAFYKGLPCSPLYQRIHKGVFINTPVTTSLSVESILFQALFSPPSFPNAVTANIWGSVNWGMYFFPEVKRDIYSVSKKEFYPLFYPVDLQLADIELKSLFEVIFVDGEKTMLTMKCNWIPNSEQELYGRSFLTQDHIYFYMNHMGFVSLIRKKLADLINIECDSKGDYDILKLYYSSGYVSKIKIFLDSGMTVQKKINLLVLNKRRQVPRSLQSLLSDFDNIDELKVQEQAESTVQRGNTIPSIVHPIPTNMEDPINIDYTKDFHLIWEKVYDSPPKVLFHAFLGDNVDILHKVVPLVETCGNKTARTSWHAGRKPPRLERKVYPFIGMTSISSKKLEFTQVIEQMVNNKYYEFYQIDQTLSIGGVVFCTETRVTIQMVSSKRSRLRIYLRPIFNSPKFNLFRPLYYLLFKSRVTKLDKELQVMLKQLGSSNEIVKALQSFGPISQVEQDVQLVPPGDLAEVVEIRGAVLFLFLTKKGVVKALNFSFGVLSTIRLVIASTISIVTANHVILFSLSLSLILNLFLMGQTVSSYYTFHKTSTLLSNYMKETPYLLQRSIQLTDIKNQISSRPHINSTSDVVYQQFINTSFLFNFPNVQLQDYSDIETSESAKILKQSFDSIGIRRNHLLVQLRILNHAEQQIAEAEWRNWLVSESRRCNQVRKLDRDITDGFQETISSIMGYCQQCSDHLEQVYAHSEKLL
ncbi:BA75_02350T0 [Komagataella pastoris]|uniref:BA75_02350T0 n=1 Tax=Komagataella pastoris TaxID=4922 RepID=A0A1B2JEL8_PICPA|nr:BA75_02350T0 [Komagataella pastoris]